MKEIVKFLEQTEKHGQLLAKWNKQNSADIRFEVLFAYWCESNGLSLNYEVGVNPATDKTVDFNFITNNGVTFNLELVRPDLNKGIRKHLTGDVLQGYLLKSDHPNEDFRTCAQQIKLQWALLEKVEKFPEIYEKTINIIVADCSNVHAGMFDRYDLTMAMYGHSAMPSFQEFWKGKKLIGMWEKGYNQRYSQEFCERISAVIFVPKQRLNLLEEALMALNPLKREGHRQLILDELKIYNAFVGIKII
jgi:hypothetical protein